jgi:hypothetical protein
MYGNGVQWLGMHLHFTNWLSSPEVPAMREVVRFASANHAGSL